MAGLASREATSTAEMFRDSTGTIVRVEDSITMLLGWRPEDLIGKTSLDLVHPQDEVGAVRAWIEMLESPGSTVVWRGRYLSASGAWTWIETRNTNQLDDPRDGVVATVMAAADAAPLSIEEQLLAREQLFSQLAEALPVGLVQFDARRNVTFTNAQLQAFLRSGVEVTIDTLLARVLGSDRDLLASALDRVLDGEPVDDLEFRLATARDFHRVCSLSLRTLSDQGGIVTGAIGCVSDVTDRVQLRRQLEFRANVDGLTSCLNRRAILDLLTDALRRRAGRSGVAVAFVDLDGFKQINDEHGHAAGDLVLVAAAERLRAATRDGDHVGRLGGDEFVVVCPDVATRKVTAQIADRVAAMLHGEIELGEGVVHLRASVGAAFAAGDIDAAELMARADAAMYEAKRLGSGQPVVDRPHAG
jgi:diguanylate cyclase (GGDEF)-like protein/PAS domain S-box-containing protein